MDSTVLLVDDHAFLRDALAEVLLRVFPQARILQAGCLDAAKCLLQDHRDVALVLLDLQLPDSHGLQALPVLRALTSAQFVVMSADQRPETIRSALRAGAVGYLPKTLNGGDMVAALKQVLAGGRFAPPMGNAAHDAADSSSGELSPRQAEVLSLLLDGASNKLIARQLDIAEATVKTHVAAIFGHFGVSSRTQVMAAVARRGLTSPSRSD